MPQYKLLRKLYNIAAGQSPPCFRSALSCYTTCMKKVGITTYRQGFTIVEILIVIVVIAILATITVVSYNGIQVRAEKDKTLTAVRAYKQALEVYKAFEGAYPTTATYCLGSGYIDRTGDGNPDCRWNSGNVNPNTAFNSALATYVQASVDITQKPVMSGSSGMVGMYFMNDSRLSLDGNPQYNWIVYAVPDKHCALNVPLLVAPYPTGGFTSKSNDTVSENWGSGGLCWIPLT